MAVGCGGCCCWVENRRAGADDDAVPADDGDVTIEIRWEVVGGSAEEATEKGGAE